MRIRIIMFSVLIGIATCLALPATSAQQRDPATTDTKLHELLTAKRDALKSRLDHIKVNFQRGAVQYDAVLLARELVLRTDLELASTKKQRIKICRERVEVYRLLEKDAGAKFGSGRTTSDATLLATANRLQAEIDCHREESNPE